MTDNIETLASVAAVHSQTDWFNPVSILGCVGSLLRMIPKQRNALKQQIIKRKQSGGRFFGCSYYKSSEVHINPAD